MFRPRSMDQVEILFLRRDLAQTLRALASARIIHLYRLGASSDIGGEVRRDQERRLERYRDFTVRAHHLVEELQIDIDSAELVEPKDFADWETWLEALRRRLGEIRNRRQELKRCRLRLIATLLFLRRWSGARASFDQLLNLRISTLQLGLLPTEALFELSDLPSGCRIYSLARVGEQRLIAFLCLRRNSKELSRLLNQLPFVPVPLFRRLHGEIGEIEVRLRRVLSRLHGRTAGLDRKVAELGRGQEVALRNRLYSARVELHLLEEERTFAYTRRTVAIGGWVPARRLKELEGLLKKTCSGHFQIQRIAARGEDTPVLLSNPSLVRPFQKILAAYGTPSYGEIEPTPLLAFAFMVLFGMMFGDLGHGLVLVAAGLSLRRWTRWRDEGLIVAEVGCFAALFGLLFGSLFGWEGLFEPFWFSPMHDIPRLMGAALAMGVGLMTAGMVLRVVNGLRQEAAGAVLTDRYGVAGILFYLPSLVLGYLVYRSLLPPAALGLLALPLAVVFFHPFFSDEKGKTPVYLLCAEGVIEVIETVLGFLANTFSFLRVAAFGLAHVGLALAVFALAEQAFKLPMGWLFAVLTHLVGNLIILVLEGLIVSIQTVRLEFYEFFGKFFRGGGIEFRPLTLDPFAERRT